VLDQFNSDNTVARQQAFDEMAERNAAILAIGQTFKDVGADELALKAIANPKMTVDAFREATLDLVSKKQAKPTRTGQLERDRLERGDIPAYGMGARDMLHGLQARSFEGVGKLLRMSDQEAAFRAGQFLRGALFGNAEALRWCVDAGMELKQGRLDGADFAGEAVSQRALTGGIFTSAGWLMPAELSTAIIINREQYGVARRICNMIPMSTNTLAIPRITGGVTAYFVGEGTQGTPSDPAGDQVNLTLKDLMCTTQYGNSTAQDSAIPLADMIAREQARGRAVKEDSCLVIGDGTSPFGGMMGFRTQLNLAAYSAGVVAAPSTQDTFAELDNVAMASLLGHLPVYARAGARWVCSGIFDATVFARLKLLAGGNTVQTVQGAVT
jgi:HK97 family phage major capsid protein